MAAISKVRIVLVLSLTGSLGELKMSRLMPLLQSGAFVIMEATAIPEDIAWVAGASYLECEQLAAAEKGTASDTFMRRNWEPESTDCLAQSNQHHQEDMVVQAHSEFGLSRLLGRSSHDVSEALRTRST